jgi:mono/diheme cytochrome c family protein
LLYNDPTGLRRWDFFNHCRLLFVTMKKIELQMCMSGMLMALALGAHAQDFPAGQIKQGSDTYARHCSPCHGMRMKNPEGAFDLSTFPKDQKERFIRSVSKGKSSMPPWEGLLKPEEIEALWAYVVTGEKN